MITAIFLCLLAGKVWQVAFRIFPASSHSRENIEAYQREEDEKNAHQIWFEHLTREEKREEIDRLLAAYERKIRAEEPKP